MSIISGVGRAAEFGVRTVRDADALQRASTLDTLVFVETGTLTEGKPAEVVAVKTTGTALMKLRHYVWQPRSNKAPATRWPMRFMKKPATINCRR